jgi:dihydroorotate dehydrogenase electron transfer subunit
VYTRNAPPGLPVEVEILPLDLLHEAPAWADFLAIDVPMRDLPNLRAALHLGPYAHLACPAQVLVITPVPCLGLGECGVCAVPTREGWRLACSDGPVFDWNSLEV